MTDENIRKRAIASFRKAIDLEEVNNDSEAYKNYLDGLALVAAVLQEDAGSHWNEADSPLSAKERRSLVGFAKNSIDRIIYLLDKQGNGQYILHSSSTSTKVDNDTSLRVVGPGQVEQPIEPSAPPMFGLVHHRDIGDQRHVESPVECMQRENRLLVSRYAARLKAATGTPQRHTLQLELERRLTENAAIAMRQQTEWEHRRNLTLAQAMQEAERKFKIREKIETGCITEIDFKKQRLYAASLQHEDENSNIRKHRKELFSSPTSERLQRLIVHVVLQDQTHPLYVTLSQMHRTILDKVQPLLQKYSEADGCFAREQQDAYMRHFHYIADDIKQDIKLLAVLFLSLFEPLSSDLGKNIVTEALHLAYFSPIKEHIILLLRLALKQQEVELASVMHNHTQDPELDPGVLTNATAALMQLMTHASPCQMLDDLVMTMKLLAVSVTPNYQIKSIGADDLLPRLLEVVLTTRQPRLLAEAQYMESFMPMDRALGEAGYCVTVLQSVLACAQPHTG